MDRPNSAIPSKARSTHSPDNQSSPASMAGPIPRRAAPASSSISLSRIDRSSALWLCCVSPPRPAAAGIWTAEKRARASLLLPVWCRNASSPGDDGEHELGESRGRKGIAPFARKRWVFSRAARGRTGKACDNSFRLFMWLRARGFTIYHVRRFLSRGGRS